MARKNRETAVNVFLGSDSSLEGHLKFSGRARLDGAFKGTIEGDGNLLVGPSARIEAEVNSSEVIVSGEIIGDVNATNRIELKAPRKGSRQHLRSACGNGRGASPLTAIAPWARPARKSLKARKKSPCWPPENSKARVPVWGGQARAEWPPACLKNRPKVEIELTPHTERWAGFLRVATGREFCAATVII